MPMWYLGGTVLDLELCPGPFSPIGPHIFSCLSKIASGQVTQPLLWVPHWMSCNLLHNHSGLPRHFELNMFKTNLNLPLQTCSSFIFLSVNFRSDHSVIQVPSLGCICHSSFLHNSHPISPQILSVMVSQYVQNLTTIQHLMPVTQI